MPPTDANAATREDVNRLSDKIDGLHHVFILRTEYTNMNTALTTLVSTVAAQVTSLSNQVEKNRDVVDRGKEESNRWIIQKFDDVEARITKKLDEQNRESKEQLELSKNSKQWLVGLLYGTASSIVVGIIIVVVTHFWH